jgi:type I restriction enzyme S subunit
MKADLSSSPWPILKLGDEQHFKLVMGQSPPGTTYNDRGEGLPFFQGKADFGEEFPTPRIFCSAPTRIAESKDILISVRAPVGPTNLANQRCAIGRGLAAIRCAGGVEPRYLLTVLRAQEVNIAHLAEGQGGGFTCLRKKQLANLGIPVPPLEKQQRLVGRIEALTRRLDLACQSRQSALAEAEMVFQKALANAFNEENTEDWRYVPAETLFEIASGQVSPLDERYKHLPYLGPEHVEVGSGRIIGEKRSVEELKMKSGKHRFTAQDVVYSKIRPALRKVCAPDYEGLCSADMYALRPNQKITTREFLKFLLLAPPFSQYTKDNSDRNAMPKINQQALLGFTFRLPSQKEQKRITTLLMTLRAKLDELRRLQTETETALARFTPALLDKAFRGEL